MAGIEGEHIIEPLGILNGKAARDAIKAGVAMPFLTPAHCADERAFTLVRFLGRQGTTAPVPVGSLSDEQKKAAARLGQAFAAGLADRPLVMGILNVTPDSFSDGGQYIQPRKAVERALAMHGEGADIIDLGGESTRPGATRITPEEEQGRLFPVIRELVAHGLTLSVDTRNADTMQRALDMGVHIINDVSALTYDPLAPSVIARYDCPVVMMHMRGTPDTMNSKAHYNDVMVEVVGELEESIVKAESHGISRQRIIADPGIGFAKKAHHNFELLARFPVLANWGCRVLLGLSRKRFLGHIVQGEDPQARDVATVVANICGLHLGNTIFRVHNVRAMVEALKVMQALAS